MDILNILYIRSIIECTDPRMEYWTLFNSVYPITFILIAYISFIFVVGPNFMKNRKPYSLKTFIQCYDIIQIVINSFIIYKYFKGGWYTRIWIYCIPFSYELSPENMELAEGCWWTLFSKIMDLLETGIFVLRKKKQQITFLHIYHHISTLLIGWIYGKNFCSGAAIFIPLLNCSVHVIMYIYYFLSSFNQFRNVINKYKHFITIIQMVQFIILFIHTGQVLLPNCTIPKTEPIILLINYIINFYLFYKFYNKAYVNGNIKQN